MGRIILICDNYPIYNNGVRSDKKELLVTYAFHEDTNEPCIVQNVHPQELGSKFDCDLNEWVIE